MAETVGRFAPSVTSREIDLSQPTSTEVIGIPAGIIGTAIEGPAFVPLTISSYGQFKATYGSSDGTRFGPIAVSEWLRNAQSATYIRVLGAGNGLKRNTTTGKVTNAGFVVGDRLVQANGNLGNNSYAADGSGDVKGRTYFLSCFMSDSAGSTIFSDAGIQTNATAVNILRGVLLAPSGVILHLSGGATGSNLAPTKGNVATNSTQGSITGSVDLGSQNFTMLMNGYNNIDASKSTAITASFDMQSSNYFAKVFNTDPYKIEERGHYLYAYYDVHPDLAVVTGSGVVVAGKEFSNRLDIATLATSSLARNEGSSTVPNYEDFEDRFSHAKTPFVISQVLGGANQNLFRIHLLSDGEGIAQKYKFSIENIIPGADANSYGQFDLVIRDMTDTDSVKNVLETWVNLSLDPESDRYISRVIGDQNIYYKFDVNEGNQKIVVDGSHPVNSNYIRIEVSDQVAKGYPNGISPSALPFGFRGPAKLNIADSLTNSGVHGGDGAYYVDASEVVKPKEMPIPYRENIAINNNSATQKSVNSELYWGIQTSLKTNPTLVNANNRDNDSFVQGYTKYFPKNRLDILNFSSENSADVDAYNNNKFTLENILVRTGSNTLADPDQWLSASYSRGRTASSNAANKTRYFNVDDLGNTSNIKFAKFTFFAQGGFNGANIFNADKANFTNNAVYREMEDPLESDVNSNTVKAYRKAIDVMTSKDDVDIQLLAIPGIRNSSVTNYAIQKVEDRFDAMYIMDIEERDQSNSVITSSAIQDVNINHTKTAFKNRNLDTSFAAAYFPDVISVDPDTQQTVQVPPSVPVLGAFSFNDSVAHPWFAPAGFSRGSLSAVSFPFTYLKQSELDTLYSVGINPIALFEGNGITIWGQKTLQAKSTALDRINVRRLLIDVRRKVKAVANTLLFEPNREETLDKFTALVNPILQRIQSQGGVERYKAVIDTSTTTQSDVENNTIRGKIYLQPVRSVEYVSLDFVVTNPGSNI